MAGEKSMEQQRIEWEESAIEAMDGVRDPSAFMGEVLTALDDIDVLMDKGPCSAPDCCQTAEENAIARRALAGTVARLRAEMGGD